MPRLIAGFITLLLGLLACTSESTFFTQDELAAKSNATEIFHKFVDDYYEATFRYSPSYATAVGIHSYDHEIEDLSETAIEKRKNALKSFAEQLAVIPGLELSFDDSIDARALSAQIQSEILEIEVIKSWQKNPMHYASLPGQAIDSLIKRDFAPAPERLKAVIARLYRIPKIHAAGRANLQNPAKEFTDLAIRMADGSIKFFDQNLADWANSAAGQDKKLLDEFKTANKIIREQESSRSH